MVITQFEELKGKTLTSVTMVGNDLLNFNCSDGTKYQMFHYQECCESVGIEDITEDWKEMLTDAKVLDAYESSNDYDPLPVGSMYYDSYTWTFYRIITDKGCVVIRWLGESSGYYSESVDFWKVT